MRLIEKGTEETYEDFYTEGYEFKLCGGSVEPKDRVEAAAASEETPSSNADQTA